MADSNPGGSTTTSDSYTSVSGEVSTMMTETHSSFPLSIEKLHGKNYCEWAQSIKLMIAGRGKFGYLSGEITKPASTDVPASMKWQSENSMVTAWLVNSMVPSVKKTYMYLPTAKDVWDAICETYSDANDSSQIFQIKTQLWQMKQGTREVTAYYTDMSGLWQELDLNVDQEWDCAGDNMRFKRRLEDERVFEFLAGLNPELDDVRGRILGRRPLPSTREVFAEVRREEKRRQVMLKDTGSSVIGTEVSALVSKGSGASSGSKHQQGQGRPWCENCRKSGHTKDT